MERREFIVAGAGSGILLPVGTGILLGNDGLSAGPNFGPVSTPASSGSTTLDNGMQAALYEGGTIAFYGASLSHNSSGNTAVVGRLMNVSGTTLERVRVRVQFLTDADELLVQGWVAEENLADGEHWQFTATYPGSDPDRIAGANIPAIETD